MPDTPADTPADVHGIDVRAARRRFERAAASAPGTDALAREVERRMAERLDLVRIEPRRILDAGCGTGGCCAVLRKRYPEALVVGVDSAQAVLALDAPGSLAARAWRRIAGTGRASVCADLAALPFAGACFSLAWSNLALPWTPDPMSAFAELRRVLERGGLLMFSSYGPDTLKELRAAFAAADAHSHVHRFIDMHDLGDMLVASGFETPVMDMELLTLTYADFDSLARDLRLSGQSNVAVARSRGLLGRQAHARMLAAYEARRRDGKLPATVEVIYGHAWRGETRVTRNGRSVVEMPQRRARSRR